MRPQDDGESFREVVIEFNTFLIINYLFFLFRNVSLAKPSVKERTLRFYQLAT